MFHVGQLVVCVDDALHDDWCSKNFYYPDNLDGLKRGVVYTIRGIGHDIDDDTPIVRLEEIVRLPLGKAFPDYYPPSHICHDYEAGFSVRRFRPLDDSRIAIFRRMLAPSPSKETADA